MKRIIIIIVIITTFLILSVGTYAFELSEVQVESLDNIINNLDDSYTHYVVFKGTAPFGNSVNIVRFNNIIRYHSEDYFYSSIAGAQWRYYRINETGLTLQSADYFSGTSINNSFAKCSSVDNVLYANDNVYVGSSDTVFFSPPNPPPYQLQFQPQPLTQSVTQNLAILLPFGLGILSLMVLVAYLPRFLKRW